jgi:hypothetical protein
MSHSGVHAARGLRAQASEPAHTSGADRSASGARNGVDGGLSGSACHSRDQGPILQNHGLYGKTILLPQALRQEDIQTPDDALRAGPMPFQVQLRAETGQPLAHALPRQLYTSQPEECLPRHMFLAEYFDVCYSHIPVPLKLEWPDDPLRAYPTLRRETWKDLLETGQPLVADGEVMDPFAERYGLRNAVCAMCLEPFSRTCTGMVPG